MKKLSNNQTVVFSLLFILIFYNAQNCYPLNHPLPKYFGLYLIKKDNIVELNKEVTDRPVNLDDKPKFLLYGTDKDINSAVSDLKLCTMKYLYKKIDHTGGSFSKSNKEIELIKKWMVPVSDKKYYNVIDLGLMPVPNQSNMLYIEPKKKLNPDAYALIHLKSENIAKNIFEGASDYKAFHHYKFFIDEKYINDNIQNFCIKKVWGEKGEQGLSKFFSKSQESFKIEPCKKHEVLPEFISDGDSCSMAKSLYGKIFTKIENILINDKISSEEKIEILIFVANNLHEASQIDNAFKILNRALPISKTIKNKYQKRGALRDLAIKFVEFGEFDQGIQILEEIESKRFLVPIYAEISNLMRQEGRMDKAEELLSKSINHIEEINKNKPDPILLFNMFAVMRDGGQKGYAQEILSKAIHSANQIDDFYSKAQFLAMLSSEMIKAGQKGKATNILSKAHYISNQIKDVEKKKLNLGLIAGIMAMNGQYKQAIQISKKIDDKFTTLYSISREMAKDGQFQSAYKIAEKIDQRHFHFRALKEISSSMAEAGFFEDALNIAEKIDENSKNKDMALKEISSSMAEAGLFEQAFQLTKKIDDMVQACLSLSNIFKYCVKIKKANNLSNSNENKNKNEETFNKMWVIYDTNHTGIFTPYAPQKVEGINQWKTTLSIKNNLNLWLEIVPGIEKRGVVLNNVECIGSEWQKQTFGKAGRRLLPPQGEMKFDVTFTKQDVSFFTQARFDKISGGLHVAEFLAKLPFTGANQIDNPIAFFEFWDNIQNITSIQEATYALESGKLTEASKNLASLLDDKQQVNLLMDAFGKLNVNISKEKIKDFLTIANIAESLNTLGNEITFAIQSKAGANPPTCEWYLKDGAPSK